MVTAMLDILYFSFFNAIGLVNKTSTYMSTEFLLSAAIMLNFYAVLNILGCFEDIKNPGLHKIIIHGASLIIILGIPYYYLSDGRCKRVIARYEKVSNVEKQLSIAVGMSYYPISLFLVFYLS